MSNAGNDSLYGDELEPTEEHQKSADAATIRAGERKGRARTENEKRWKSNCNQCMKDAGQAHAYAQQQSLANLWSVQFYSTNTGVARGVRRMHRLLETTHLIFSTASEEGLNQNSKRASARFDGGARASEWMRGWCASLRKVC